MRSVKKLDVESPLADSRQRPSIAIPSPYLLNYNYRFSDLEKKTASLGKDPLKRLTVTVFSSKTEIVPVLTHQYGKCQDSLRIW